MKDLGASRGQAMSAKAKWLRMVILALGYMGAGTAYVVPGTSLIDLTIRTSSTTKDVSLMFLLRAGGGLIGSLFGGFLLDLVNADIVLVVVQALAACTIVVAPWWQNAVALSAFIGISGLACSMVNVGVNFYCVSLWEKAHPPYLLFLTFLNNVACTAVLPLVSMLLLHRSPEPLDTHPAKDNVSENNLTDLYNTGHDLFQNVTVTNTSSLQEEFSPEDVTVQYAFLVPGALLTLACLGHSVLAISSRCNLKPLFRTKQKTPTDNSGTVAQRSIRKPKIILLLIGFGLLAANVGSVEETYMMYLFTFLVNHLSWSKAMAAWPMIGLQSAIFFSQFSCIIVSKYIRSSLVMVIIQSTMLVSTIVMCLPVLEQSGIVWACTIFIGIAIGPYGSTLISWMSSIFGPSGKITSFFFLVLYGNRMIMSQVLGHLFDSSGPIWFAYINISTVGVSSLAFIFLLLLTEVGRKDKEADQVIDNKSMEPMLNGHTLQDDQQTK